MKPLKMLLIAIVLGIILVIAFTFILDSFVKQSTKPYEDMLNKKIVIENDTLTVIDYSSLKDEIILSNGKKVALKYAQLNIIKNN